MQINWCHKGISEQTGFGDAEALAVLSSTGILSRWMVNQAALSIGSANAVVQNSLSLSKLDNHVNHYASGGLNSPYISLAAGCYEYGGPTAPPVLRSGIAQASRFATRNGRYSGYIFKCWVVTAPKISADLPGMADEVRDLNLFNDFYSFHRQGEITAKIYVPRRQVLSVAKIDATGNGIPLGAAGLTAVHNPDFAPPERVSNLIEAI